MHTTVGTRAIQEPASTVTRPQSSLVSIEWSAQNSLPAVGYSGDQTDSGFGKGGPRRRHGGSLSSSSANSNEDEDQDKAQTVSIVVPTSSPFLSLLFWQCWKITGNKRSRIRQHNYVSQRI
eukprot:gb/GECG01008734.1/.p1 GENE.gb/GECG01008734.1/~~gb/GECG01008734.1/.p1  ORF type:complete len:121 (+),score=9.59 gb/GECG01008734.1/:1-363(+)